ncbi:MAG TPA: c-type cytochrome [Thermoanaerobaculia bacterium]|nr:c-type cytochrome [Thermoanaerobaculia bacterium]
MYRNLAAATRLARAAAPLLALLAACAPTDQAAPVVSGESAETTAPPAVAQPAAEDPVARGRYLVTISGCNDCHTPFAMGPQGPAPDMTRMLSGHPADLVMPPPPELGAGPWVWAGAGTNTAFAGPWGVSYANNLTPDPNTGIGIWTEAQFIQTLRTGRHWGVARPILPPMPWPNYARMTDEDLAAMWAYLRSIPPIRNQAPASVPAPPPAPPATTGL